MPATSIQFQEHINNNTGAPSSRGIKTSKRGGTAAAHEKKKRSLPAGGGGGYLLRSPIFFLGALQLPLTFDWALLFTFTAIKQQRDNPSSTPFVRPLNWPQFGKIRVCQCAAWECSFLVQKLSRRTGERGASRPNCPRTRRGAAIERTAAPATHIIDSCSREEVETPSEYHAGRSCRARHQGTGA